MISINGRNYVGRNISIAGNKVYIDGKLEAAAENDKVINITVTGNLEKLECEYADTISIEGDCHSVDSRNGNVKIQGNVTGNVENRNGNIKCGNVGGDAKTRNGDINYIK